VIVIEKNVMNGQAKGCLLRIQIRYTAIFIKSWSRHHNGFHIGIFAPEKFDGDYKCLDFYWYGRSRKWWYRETKNWRDWNNAKRN